MSRQYTGEWVVSSLLAERAERFGTEIAVSSEQGQLTYEDLVERAARMAGGFAALGARPGDRIATMLPTGNDYLAAWHACIWLGAIEVPVNVEYRGPSWSTSCRTPGPRSLSSTLAGCSASVRSRSPTSVTSSSSASRRKR